MHDECELLELDVKAWRDELEDRIARVLARYDTTGCCIGKTAIDCHTAAQPRMAEE